MNPSQTQEAIPQPQTSSPFEQPILYEDEAGSVQMFFHTGEIQSHMWESAPDDLVLPYTRAMMAFLLLHRAPSRITMIGLGGGSMPKWCYRHLPQADITVLEINPHVIGLRDHFYIPHDDERFRVLCQNGAAYISGSTDEPDVLVVDGFDAEGQPPELCSQSFYDNCYTALCSEGLMIANLCDSQDNLHLARIHRSFGDNVLVATFEDGTNKVVCASKGCSLRSLEAPGPRLEERLRKLQVNPAVRLIQQGIPPIADTTRLNSVDDR